MKPCVKDPCSIVKHVLIVSDNKSKVPKIKVIILGTLF